MTSVRGRWSLDDLASPERLDEDIDELNTAVVALEKKRSALTPEIGVDEFREIIGLVEQITAGARRLRAYADLWFAEDTGNQSALAFQGRIEKLLTDVRNRTLFFELWWKGLPDETADRLLAASGDVRYYLETLRRFTPYTLSEVEERVINVKDATGASALVTLYDMITNSFSFTLEVDGVKKTLTRSQLMTYAHDPNPDLRAAAYQELYRVYGAHGTLLGQIYQYVVRNWNDEEIGLRGFSSPIAPRNLQNDIPDAVVDTLLAVCRDNASVFQDYFRLKAKWLGMERLRRYDLYAPLGASPISYTLDEAVSLVLESLARFSPELAGHARRVIEEGHLDAEVRPGKEGGAFCYGVLPGLTPWVLLNYNGRYDDVSTLAHELGHAVHALMAADHSPLTFHSALPLAETASVFSEILLLENTLEKERDPRIRREVLARFVDGAYATVTRQAYFVLFEREAHGLIVRGITTDELSARYLENLHEQFGDAVAVGEEFRWEWVSIPHIYQTPFYCYAYSFGQLLVLGLYKLYKEEGKSFVPKYLRILAHGGAAAPQEILDEAGIDMADPAFWQGGFDVISEMIARLEEG